MTINIDIKINTIQDLAKYKALFGLVQDFLKHNDVDGMLHDLALICDEAENIKKKQNKFNLT